VLRGALCFFFTKQVPTVDLQWKKNRHTYEVLKLKQNKGKLFTAHLIYIKLATRLIKNLAVPFDTLVRKRVRLKLDTEIKIRLHQFTAHLDRCQHHPPGRRQLKPSFLPHAPPRAHNNFNWTTWELFTSKARTQNQTSGSCCRWRPTMRFCISFSNHPLEHVLLDN
jgi:hypothetical protein